MFLGGAGDKWCLVDIYSNKRIVDEQD